MAAIPKFGAWPGQAGSDDEFDDDTAPQKDASSPVAVDKNLQNIDWFIYEPIDTIKIFDDSTGEMIDLEQAHWDTIPLDWPADKPMRIQLPVGPAGPVCTVPPPCTTRSILQSIYDFYQTPLTKSDLLDLGITLDRRAKEHLREEHPPRRFHLQGSTALKFGISPPDGERRHPLSCM
jgi:hypothetical protein